MKKGLTHLYFGDGKGKTTASMGLVLRALGTGCRVMIFQFLKESPSGEHEALKAFENVTVSRCATGITRFLWDMTAEEKETYLSAQRELFEKAALAAQEGRADLVILDEALRLPDVKALDWESLRELIVSKSPSTELVLTGGDCPECVREVADYITRFQKCAHPYDKGQIARRGIEF